jgi:hypothetical protein
METGARPAPAKKQDRSTLPALAFIASCVMAAYGFKTGSALFLWMLPAILMVIAIAWSFWPTRKTGDSGRSA